MPRSRTTEMTQRPSPRGGPSSLRTSSSDSDHRSRPDNRSPKLSGGRSPRGSQSDIPVNNQQKKLGSRIADLESQLGQAQHDLKCLKNQLVSAESAKKAAQEQLDKKKSKKPPKKTPEPVEIQRLENEKDNSIDECEQETDVFEVQMEKVTVETKIELDLPGNQDKIKPEKSVNLSVDELELKNNEISLLKTKLDERDKELEALLQENESIKSQLQETSLKVSSSESEIQELSLKLKKTDQELEKSKTNNIHMNEKLEASEIAKEELENEMKMLRVQTEQWKKAADVAANILAGEVETNERRISQRCGSMDKHYYGNAFESGGGYAGFVSSSGPINDGDDGYGGGKRKGIRMFGDLWKKKGHK